MAYMVQGKQLVDVNILDVSQFMENGWHVLRKESGEVPVRNLEGTAALEAINRPYESGDVAFIVNFGADNSSGGPVEVADQIPIDAPLKHVFTLSRNVYSYRPSSSDIAASELDFEGYSGIGMQNIGYDTATVDNIGGSVFYFAKLWDDHIESGNALGLPKLYVLNFSVPFQSLYSGAWNPARNSGGVADLVKRIAILFKAYVNKIVMLGENPRLLGLVFNNFELDALEGGDAQESYADNLEKIYSSICDTVGIYYLPIFLSNPIANDVINEYTARSIRTQVLNFVIKDSRFRHTLLNYGNDVFSTGYKYSTANYKRHSDQLFSLVRLGKNRGLPLIFDEYEPMGNKDIPEGKAGQLLSFDKSGNLVATDGNESLPSGKAGQVLGFDDKNVLNALTLDNDPFPFLQKNKEAKVGELYRYIRDDGQLVLVVVNSELSNGRSVYPERLVDSQILKKVTSRGTFNPFIDISATPDNAISKFELVDSFLNPTNQTDLLKGVFHARAMTQDGKIRVSKSYFSRVIGIGADGDSNTADITGSFYDIPYLAGDVVLYGRDSFDRFSYRLIRPNSKDYTADIKKNSDTLILLADEISKLTQKDADLTKQIAEEKTAKDGEIAELKQTIADNKAESDKAYTSWQAFVLNLKYDLSKNVNDIAALQRDVDKGRILPEPQPNKYLFSNPQNELVWI